MELAVALSILASVISVASFVLNRKDKAIKDKGELDEESSNQKLLDYRLTQVEKKLDKIIDLLDSYENETRKIAEEEIEKHVLKYHK